MNTLGLSDILENLREPGTSRLSATSVAHLFDLQLQELAELAKVHRNTLRVHPESPKLQRALRDLVRLLCAAQVLQPDLTRAVFLLKNTPLPTFGHETPLELMAADRVNDAVEYLESISVGFCG